jgi:ABC-type glutathione transport system ATPase component
MRRREIAQKFEQIVEFSEIPWFIDTPVKRYSSGMQARLGFAVAAHLDPEVLIIDEVLAVGDAAFQRKAFQRVTELVRRDIPVVVVSHQLDAIVELCTHALLLQKGRVVRDGTPRECIAQYLDGIAEVRPAAPGESAVRIDALKPAEDFACSGAPLDITLECTVRPGGWTDAEAVSLRIRSPQTGEILFTTSTLRLGVKLPETGQFELAFELQLNVPAGVYVIESFVWDRIMERESFAGPRRHLEVRGGDDFEGPVQMNPRVNVRSGDSRVDT